MTYVDMAEELERRRVFVLAGTRTRPKGRDTASDASLPRDGDNR